jgi:hypothetical protein
MLRLGKQKDSESTSIIHLSKYAQSLTGSGIAPGPIIADKQQNRWRGIYYQSRSFVIVASAIITALTALNIHGSPALSVRVITLVLSTFVTVLTGLLELLQVNHRWRLYRQLRGTLEHLGWKTAASGGGQEASLAALGDGLMKAMRDFETGYMSQVAGAGDLAASGDTHKRDRKSAGSSEAEQIGGTSAQSADSHT